MEFNVCSQCGVDIEGKGIKFRKNVFCSDECCDEFEAELAKRGGPVLDVLDDLDEDLDDDFDDEELGYGAGRQTASGGYLEDDFEISPDDF